MFTRPALGITLIEIILWVAIVAAAVVAVFAFAKATRVSAAVETEQRQVQTIVKTVDSLFALQPNFSALGSDGALYLTGRNAERSGLTITRNAAGDPTLTTGLGDGRLTLSAWDVVRPVGPAIANGGYRLAYEGLSPKECAQLASALSSNTQQVSIGITGLSDAYATVVSHRYDPRVGGPEVIANMCARPDRVVFLYFAPARAIAATGAVASPGPLARCRPVRETQYSACPVGQTGTVTQTRDGTCTGPGNTLVWTVWTTTNSTCQDAAVVPPTVVAATTPDDCATITTTRVQACTGVGETGQIVEQSTLDTCAGTSTPWTQVPALTTCQAPPPPACVSSSQREEHVPCPAGQGGEIVRERYSTCSSPTALQSWPAWNSTHVVSNTCTNACSQGGGSCCEPIPETRPAPCPAGTYGPGGQEIRFQGCANATTQSATWSAWQPYRDLEPSAGCTSCPATITETETNWDPRSDTCPAGQMGSITYEAEQVRTRDISYTCPSGTTALPTPTTSTWGTWADTGATRNWVDTCAASPPPGCLSGQIGADVMSAANWWCPGYNTSPTDWPLNRPALIGADDIYIATTNDDPKTTADDGGGTMITGWQTMAKASWASCALPSGDPMVNVGDFFHATSYQRLAGTPLPIECGTATPPTQCDIPAGTIFSWTVGTDTCTYTQSTATAIAIGDDFPTTDSTAPTTGAAAFNCDAMGTLSTTANPGATCSAPVASCYTPAPTNPALLTGRWEVTGYNTLIGGPGGGWFWDEGVGFLGAIQHDAARVTQYMAAVGMPGSATFNKCIGTAAGQASVFFGVTPNRGGAQVADPRTTWLSWNNLNFVDRLGNNQNINLAGWTEIWVPRFPPSTLTCVPGEMILTRAYNGFGSSTHMLIECVNAPVQCSVPAGHVFNWTAGGNACTFTQGAASTVAAGTDYPVADSTAPATGNAAFNCSAGGVLSSTPQAGATCVVAGCVPPSGPLDGVWQSRGPSGTIDPYGGAPGNIETNIGDLARRNSTAAALGGGSTWGAPWMGEGCYNTPNGGTGTWARPMAPPPGSCIVGERIASRTRGPGSSSTVYNPGETFFFDCVAPPSPSGCMSGSLGSDVLSPANWWCSEFDMYVGGRTGQPVLVDSDGNTFIGTTSGSTITGWTLIPFWHTCGGAGAGDPMPGIGEYWHASSNQRTAATPMPASCLGPATFASCSIPAGWTASWTLSGKTCTYVSPAVQTLTHQQGLVMTDSTAPNTGAGHVACSNGVVVASPSGPAWTCN